MITEQKLDKVLDVITDIKIDITAIKKDLEYHIYRTDLLDHKIDALDKQTQPIIFKVKALTFTVAVLSAGVPIILKLLKVW